MLMGGTLENFTERSYHTDVLSKWIRQAAVKELEAKLQSNPITHWPRKVWRVYDPFWSLGLH